MWLVCLHTSAARLRVCTECRSISEKMNKGKKSNVKPFMVKNYLSVFITCMIENPAFDSQVTFPSLFEPCPHFTWCMRVSLSLQHTGPMTLHRTCQAAACSLNMIMRSSPGPAGVLCP